MEITELKHDFFVMDCNCELSEANPACESDCLYLNCDNCEHLIDDGESYFLFESDTLCNTCVKNIFLYYVNLDERGEFEADVRDFQDKTVFEIDGFEIFQDGFMAHDKDLDGLQSYLIRLEVLPKDAELFQAN